MMILTTLDPNYGDNDNDDGNISQNKNTSRN